MENTTIESFAASLDGRLVRPQDSDYDDARKVYNAMHDRRPAAIVQARTVADVSAAVRFARTHGLLLAVRGGGHSVPGFGTCDAGLVIDLGAMNAVHVDPQANSVRAQGGCTLGDVDQATHAHGLAVPAGVVSTTGLGGLALGGGMGHLSRSGGLSCDNLRAAEVVTASGEVVNCSAEEHPDLFWALRGGGGNFGVVTEFTFSAHPVDTVFAGPTFFRIDADVIRNYQDLLARMPEALNALFAITRAPPAPFVPEAWQRQPVMAVLACWRGPEADDDTVLEAVTDLGEVVGQALWRMPHPEVNTFFDELLPKGLRHYWKANAFDSFTEDAIAVHMAHGPEVFNIESGIFVFPIDGACHRVAPGETAFANRTARFSAVISGTWHEARDDQANTAWVRDYYDALQPFSTAGGYVNFMSGDDAELAIESYGEQLQKLAGVKAAWDPENLFRCNQNIRPARH